MKEPKVYEGNKLETDNKRFQRPITGSEHIDKTTHYKYKASKQVCVGGADMKCNYCKDIKEVKTDSGSWTCPECY